MKANRKIIITTHTYYPNKDGVAIVNEYLSIGMVKKGYDVVVVTHENYMLPKEEYHDGVRIIRVFRNSSPQDYIECVKNLVNEEDTLVNVCTQTPTTDVLFRELSNIKCKKILYVHGIIKFKWSAENYNSLHNILSKIYNNAKWRLYYNKVGKYIKCYDAIIQLHKNDEGNVFLKKSMDVTDLL
ncbi:hypothetical protein [Butyrivibrio fibrisolvens]|uniref:hypothetical protein n=1 Tax=Butyrivibrio fibrisolvens TaxID=831 RepID=UPI00040085C5|nr:hypothetical protein [Butyrivibrio fibrisolvens]